MKVTAGIKSILISSLLLILATGCEKRPKGVLSEKDTIDLLTDLEMAEAYYTTTPHNSSLTREMLIESVLEKHGVSKEELDSTLAYYGKNIDSYYVMYQEVGKKIREKNGLPEANIEEKDIWPYSHFAAILPEGINNGITFSFPTADIEKGEGIEWRMRLSSSDGVEAMLGVEYMNGISSIVKKGSDGQKTLSLQVITDTAQPVKRVFGIMTLPTSSLPAWADSIRLIKTEYDSLAYTKFRSQKRLYRPVPRPPEIISNTDSIVID